jgi:hypothetical protein
MPSDEVNEESPMNQNLSRSSTSSLLAVVPLTDNRLQLWYAYWNSMPAGEIYSSWQLPGTYFPNQNWSPFSVFNTVDYGDNYPAIVASTIIDGRPQFWALTGAGLYSCWKLTTDANSPWSPWQQFLGASPEQRYLSGLTVGPISDNRLQIFALKYNTLVTTWQESLDPDAPWRPWQPFPYPSVTERLYGLPPTAICATNFFNFFDTSHPQMQLFTLDNNGGIWTCWKQSADPSSKWGPGSADQPWISFTPIALIPDVPGPTNYSTANGLIAGNRTDGTPQLFGYGTLDIWTCWKKNTNPADFSWTPWTRLRPPSQNFASGSPAPSSGLRCVTTSLVDIHAGGKMVLWALDDNGNIFVSWNTETGDPSAWSSWSLFCSSNPPPWPVG